MTWVILWIVLWLLVDDSPVFLLFAVLALYFYLDDEPRMSVPMETKVETQVVPMETKVETKVVPMETKVETKVIPCKQTEYERTLYGNLCKENL